MSAYDRIAEQWQAARSGFRPKEQGYLDRLLAGLAPKSCVLDLGCGTGRPNAEYIVARGFSVVGIDQSEAMLAKARAALPAETWIQGDLETADPGRMFSAGLCWDALFHLERARHAAVLTRVREWLVPGGRLLFSTGGSANPPFTDQMWNHDFFYDAHPPDEMVALVRERGFEIEMTEMTDPPRGGREKGKFTILARKPA